ncbi:purine-nucleoside phosphorylase [Leucobacter massiliensis]|uniref:Purine-nucleoside phosphorylase n=1 Tax=Leucobacter massiliensis TaxID=1686285 RepID=A0A2S9QKY1_9MICO|nr:purine-nucleoside phosphorylase [Leucobacter massiliensis]PRI10248.1 purine-nucleoside phosphorylase [Leucobacter massiliensis]
MTQPSTLLVFAHRDEAHAFSDLPHLVTGVGKVSAAVSLSAALAGGGVERVVVLGTAGVVSDGPRRPSLDEVYQIEQVVQHDFSLPSPALRPAGETILPAPSRTVLATGDVFVQNDAQRARIAALGAELVDMEAYAYARVCEQFAVPLQIFKVPSDFADSSTTDAEWDTIVFRKSEQLREFWETGLRGTEAAA